MTQYIQLHLLTAYAPSNLNRDDQGRPKTAKMGGVERMRISSQSIKRAWRTSELFEEGLHQALGVRTRRLGREVYEWLQQGGMSEKQAFKVAQLIAAQFGKLKSEKKPKDAEQWDDCINLEIEQLAHISHQEWRDLKALCVSLGTEKREPDADELQLLRKENTSVDIALFGRMLASSPAFNVEAACQVAHAIGVSGSTVEDDFFSAVDDLNKGADATGAGHIGEQGFGSALYYTYLSLSRDLLLENLGGDEVLTQRAIAALLESAVKVSPSGKQNSFASRAYADYVLAEVGTEQPRSLAVAFFKPVVGQDQLASAIQRLRVQRDNLDKVYGPFVGDRMELCVPEGLGSFAELQAFVCEPFAKP